MGGKYQKSGLSLLQHHRALGEGKWEDEQEKGKRRAHRHTIVEGRSEER